MPPLESTFKRNGSRHASHRMRPEVRHPKPLQHLTLRSTLPSYPPTRTDGLISMLPLKAESADLECLEEDERKTDVAGYSSERYGTDIMCPKVHDGITCWPTTKVNAYARVPCPQSHLLYNSSSHATRLCGADGKWSPELSDYLLCATDKNILQRIATTKDSDPPREEANLDVPVSLLGRIIQNCAHLMEKPKLSDEFQACPDGYLSVPGAGCIRIFSLEKTFVEARAICEPRGATLVIPDNFEALRQYVECKHRVLFCPRTFDGWSCWNDTPAGETAYSPCPYFITGFDHNRMAHKVCKEDGSWYRHPETNLTWSNYTTCIDLDDLKMRQLVNTIYIAGYSVSLIALVISLVIFCYFSSLQCTRIRLHKNLFVSFILNNILWIAWYMEVAGKPVTVSNNETGCQILHVLLHYFLVSSYYWMFSEGLYLHTLLVVAFVTEEKLIWWFYLLGWGAPAIIVAIYAGVRGASETDTQHCWINESHYSLILSIPVCFSILVNLVFLINIVRVLVTKLRANHLPDDTRGTRKAVRATLILIPLLGLHYVLLPVNPIKGSKGEVIYQIVAALASSFQGFCVALLFCFCNSEVIMALKKKWYQYQSIHDHHRFSLSTACALSVNSKGAQELRRLSPLRRSRPHSPGHPIQQGGTGERGYDGGVVCETDSPPWSCVVVETRIGAEDEEIRVTTSMEGSPKLPISNANTALSTGNRHDQLYEHFEEDVDEGELETTTLMNRSSEEDQMSCNEIQLETIEEMNED